MTAETDGVTGSVRRRELLKRGAALGAAAWTAPVIVGSLASPAGALTLKGGFCVGVTASTCAGTPPAAATYSTAFGASTCAEASCGSQTVAANTPLADFCITPSTCVWSGDVAFTIGAGCGCTFTGGTGAIPKPGSQCQGGTLSNNDKTITFTVPGSATGNWFGFQLQLTCA